MTKFNPENKTEGLTYADILGPAMEITDQEDADQYKAAYITHIEEALKKEPREDDMTAEQIANTNLAYYAGYYGEDVRARVEKLFKCAHPIFGSIEENGSPTAEQAFNLGQKAGEKAKAEQD